MEKIQTIRYYQLHMHKLVGVQIHWMHQIMYQCLAIVDAYEVTPKYLGDQWVFNAQTIFKDQPNCKFD